MRHNLQSISFQLPPWVADFAQHYSASLDLNTRMTFVLDAARQNMIEKTGGPFAAAIFNSSSGELVSLGVNLVTTERLSILHAEIVAIAFAQRSLGAYDLGQEGLAPHELVTSSEPCAMCFGAIPWCGVHRVVVAAREQDVRKIGFDEGPKLADWRGELERRGIRTIVDLMRDAAVGCLNEYAAQGGIIYGGRGTSRPGSKS